MEGIAVALLPGQLPRSISGRVQLCLGASTRRWPTSRKPRRTSRSWGRGGSPRSRARIAECRSRKGEARCRARTGARTCSARAESIERGREDGAAARARAGTRATEAGRPVGRARLARRESRGGTGTHATYSRRRSPCFIADRARPTGRRRASAGNGERDTHSSREPQGPRRSAGALPPRYGPTKEKRPRRAASLWRRPSCCYRSLQP